MSTKEEVLRKKNSGLGLENREYGRRDLPRWPRDTLYPQKSAQLRWQAAMVRSV
jgi:hypothetical protein